MANNLKDLIRKRGSKKASFTVFQKYIKSIDTDDLSEKIAENIRVKLDKIRCTFIEFESIQEAIEINCDDEELECHYQERYDISANFDSLVDIAEAILSKSNSIHSVSSNTGSSKQRITSQTLAPSAPVSDPGSRNQAPTLQGSQVPQCTRNNCQSPSIQLSGIKLPTIDLPKFTGQTIKWLEFKVTYESLLHYNNSINDIQKFHYLRAALCGEPLKVIQSLEFTYDNYAIAWDLLCNRYNNSKSLVNSHVKSIFNLEPLTKENARGLRHLIDNTYEHLRALESLKEPVQHWDTLIIYIINSKLDKYTSTEWEKEKAQTDSSKLQQFMEFLKSRADLLETIDGNLSINVKPFNSKRPTNTSIQKQSSFVTASTGIPKCNCCKQDHLIYSCKEFLDLSLPDRLKKVKELKLCMNCLRTGHEATGCRLGNCKKCPSKHNTLLHDQKASDSSQSLTFTIRNMIQNALLATAIVHVYDRRGRRHSVRVLLDSGSQSNFISKDLFSKLGLKKYETNVVVSGISNIIKNLSFSCDVEIHSKVNDVRFNLNCLIMDNITQQLPADNFGIKHWPIPTNIQLADPEFNTTKNIDILLGTNHFWDILQEGSISLGKNLPRLQNTTLGWIVAGKVGGCTSRSQCNLSINEFLFDLRSFWESEECDAPLLQSTDDKECERQFQEGVIRNNEGLCEIEGGQSNIILDIEESRGHSISQETTPAELPISGEPNVDIFLDLSFPKGPPIFFLNGKKLQLLSPLDRDENSISHIVFQLICTIKSTHKKRTVPVIVRLTDINDNAPEFVNTPYVTSISELTPVGTTIFQNVVAKDKDTGVNGLVEYSIIKGDGFLQDEGIGRKRIHSADGYGFFAINLPHQGQVTVNRTLDFEKTQRYYVTIVATDRARDVSQRLSSTTTLIVNIKDDDDQNPSFIYKGCMLLDGTCINPEYSASVSSGVLHGILNISPEKIQAVDMDTINSPIRYSFVSGTPETYADYFRIDPDSGAVHQIRVVDTSTTKKFTVIIKAQEVSEANRSTTAKLFITVKPVDANPPEIQLSSTDGFVDENSPVGTAVSDSKGNPLTISVVDKDFSFNDPRPTYTYELTSPYFTIDKNGHLVVNENNLDRDPPNPGRFKFQIVAREKNGTAASSPASLTVSLNDVNDNAPVLPMIPPVTVPAGDSKRKIITVKATDNDEGKNAMITYSIYHVSNNGNNKFAINPVTGDLEAVGRLNAGDQYSLTVQATDDGGLYSQAIVEVTVSPGPNTQSPIFEQSIYDIEVSEGATINSTVATVQAIDPENDPVTYAIVSGNDLRQFAVGAKTGVITVIRKLDREDLTRYKLIIRAEDSGKLSSTATINIKVTDINDKNPEFVGHPYNFTVREGLNSTSVGFVRAIDADEGINALVTYSIPSDLPFAIDHESGEIITIRPLDYETQKEFQFVVTAKDGAPDPRIATATVTVSVVDIEDEVPIFKKLEYEATVPENMPDYFVTDVTAYDPDTVKKITYVIHRGPTDLFRIDETSGLIFTTRGLDYEKDIQHVLIIGTLENMSSKEGSTTRVIVNVDDRNDIPPVFTIIPHPITLDDDVSIGTSVTTLIATDSDGTAPGNKVRYEIIGRGKSPKYFQIDPDTGLIKVTNDLKKEIDTEYQVDVRAFDLGEPQLSSVITLDIYIQHVATVAPEVGLGFADTSYTVQVPENATVGDKIKTFTIVNSKTHGTNIPLKCQVVEGNKEGKFLVNVTEDRNCALYLNGSLDYEDVESYYLELQIMSLQGFINKEFSIAQINVNVVDINDNIPYFIYPSGTTLKKLYAAITDNSPLATTVIQIESDDKDSGKYGKIKYSLHGKNSEEYFLIDQSSGIIKTRQTFESVDPSVLPFKLLVKARDNPNASDNYHEIEAPVIVNVIYPEDILILTIGDAKPDAVKTKLDAIINVIQEHSGLIVGIEKLTTRQYISGNGTLETDSAATDILFYMIDPETDEILPRNHSLVRRSVLDKLVMDNITLDITSQIKSTAFDIHEPIVLQKTKSASIASLNGEVFPYALIIIACIIFILGIVGIIYICISWSRYKSYKDQMQRQYVVPASPARYDTVYVEPNLKEYETQVLQMCVPVDDPEDYNDLHLDFSNKNHAFSLDNVSYISKDNNLKKYGQQSPVSSESATTARASSVGDNNVLSNNDHSLRRDNIIYRSSDDEEMNASPTNENVMFKEKKDYSHMGYTYDDNSPVETTTEL